MIIEFLISHKMSCFPMSWGDLMDEEERLENRTAIERVKDEFNDVINFRNHSRNCAPNEASFQKQMDHRLVESMKYLHIYKENAIRDDEICYWKTRGLICMESSKYTNEAVEALSKVVELDPTAVLCWNNLGEAYCAIKNWELGKKCFLSALKHEKNPDSLQNLSMWCRMNGSRNPSDIQKGIEYAKEALALDFSSVKSWTILGNAYMAAFFAAQQNQKYVTKALYAYRLAEKGGPEDVDVCANKFVALKFLEYFEEALQTLLPAYTRPELDWRQKKLDYESLLCYLKSIQELVDKKGKLRSKKLAEFIKQLKPEEPSKSREPKGLLSALPRPDGDAGRLKGIIIFILSPDGSYPYTLGMLTGSGDVYVVTVFNLRRDKGFKIGGTISLPAITKTVVDFTINNETFKFTKMRIYMPTQIELNGKRLTSIYLNPMTIVSS